MEEKWRHYKTIFRLLCSKETKHNAYYAVKEIVNGTLFHICIRSSYNVQRKIEQALYEAYELGLSHGFMNGLDNKK